jgi:vacuolar protein sorting-associated protein 18
MSVVDDWNLQLETGDILPQGDERPPLFTLEHRIDLLCRGRGHSVAFTVSNDTIFIATSRNYLLRHDPSGTISELEITKVLDTKVRRLFVDPTGEHALILLQFGSGANAVEMYYLDSSWKKPRPIAKLKGIMVTSIAWNTSVSGATTTSMCEALIGTATGSLILLSLDNKASNKKERVDQMYELHNEFADNTSPIAGLAILNLSRGKKLVLALCGTKVHLFSNNTNTTSCSLDDVFQSSAAVSVIDLPLDAPAAQLQLLSSLGNSSYHHRHSSSGGGERENSLPFAVLSPSGIYMAKLDTSPTGISDDAERLRQAVLLPSAVFDMNNTASKNIERPMSMALTQYHLVLLYPTRLQFINRTSKRQVQVLSVDQFATPMRGMTALPLGLTRDPSHGGVYVLAGDDCFEVESVQEDGDMWQVLIEKGDFNGALVFAQNARQRNAIYLAHGEALLEQGRAVEAAPIMGRLTSAVPSFEDLAVRLLESEGGGSEALALFLQSRLDTLGKEDAAQATLVATWLTELYLDTLNHALLQRGTNGGKPGHLQDKQGDAADQAAARLCDFLTKYVHILDPGTTISLLAGYGRTEELTHYAKCRGDAEAVIEHLLAAGEVEKVLEVLRKPSVSEELAYKFASALAKANPGATVQSWIDASPPLDPRRLLPALLHFGELSVEGGGGGGGGTSNNATITYSPQEERMAASAGRKDALKYIWYCIYRLETTDTAVHNLAFSLLSVEPSDEGRLLEYVGGPGRGVLGKPLFDPIYGLRLAQQMGRKRVAVSLLEELGMFDDAVNLALTFDRDLAVNVARQACEDVGDVVVGRKLWMVIARHIIEDAAAAADVGENDEEKNKQQQREAINKATQLLEESNGVLRIEDILPMFPDFVEIDAFRDAVCSSLERYNREIQELRSEMSLASKTAQIMRDGLKKLEGRVAAVDPSAAKCARCDRIVAQPSPTAAGPSGGCLPKYYVFPTGNVFHGSCLCVEVAGLVPRIQAKRIQDLQQKLAQMVEGSYGGGTSDEDTVAELRGQLEREVCSEDPYCGEMCAEFIKKPFIVSEEENKGWEL